MAGRLTDLAGATSAGDVRGALGQHRATPVSAAVVIGLGGSGIQTVARVRSAVRADRPDQAAADSIRFLGIDAVDVSKQHPSLPPGVQLSSDEFLNLTEVPFDPAAFVRSQLQHNASLKAWFDPTYFPPSGAQVEGMKRERMLGRLVFFREFDRLTAAVSRAIDRAADIGHMREQGQVDSAGLPQLPVHIVASSCGGTGSSGLLETVLAVWRAARARGVGAKITVYTYLPGVFQAAVQRTPNGSLAAEAQRSNAFAFFRELDHFLVHGESFGREMGLDLLAGGPEIHARGLVHQVYLLDGFMQGIGVYGDLRDVYEVAAEAIYQFLLTDAGRPLVGVDAVNTDQALGQLDHWDKARRYCSLGVARVVFPGETYRTHLTMRYADWYLTEALIRRSSNLPEAVRDSRTWQDLETQLPSLIGALRRIDVEEEVSDLLYLADHVADNLAARPTPDEARKFRNRIELESPAVVKSLQRTLAVRSREQLRLIERAVVDAARVSGEGIPFNIEVLRRLRKVLERRLTAAVGATSSAEILSQEAEQRVAELMDELGKADARRVGERMLTMVTRGRSAETVARDLGQALQGWARSIVDQQYATAEKTMLEEALRNAVALRGELERAETRVAGLAAAARVRWEHDELIGKDAGPTATTTLVPSDAQPEVEESRFARTWFTSFSAEHAATLEGEPLTEFVERWIGEGQHRGYFSLGARDADEARVSIDLLLATLDGDADVRALQQDAEDGSRVPRLPVTLEDAAAQSGEGDRLRSAVDNLEALSRHVSWAWDPGRFRLKSGADGDNRQTGVVPTVSSVVARDRSCATLLTSLDERKVVDMDDPERIVALSVEWAVPLHAVSAVDLWRADYERVLRRRRVDPASEPPSHIKVGWDVSLDPVMPSYGDLARIVDVLAKALSFNMLVQDEDRAQALFVPSSRNGPGPLLERVDERWVGRVLQVKGDQLVSGGGSVDLGADWSQVLELVSKESALQSAVRSAWELARRSVGRTAATVAVEQTLTKVHEASADKRLESTERDALKDVLDGLDALHSELTQSRL